MARTYAQMLTLREAVDAVLEDSDSGDDESQTDADICILPPSDISNSENEDIDEDNFRPAEPAEVCGKLEIFSREENNNSTEGENVGKKPVVRTKRGRHSPNERNTDKNDSESEEEEPQPCTSHATAGEKRKAQKSKVTANGKRKNVSKKTKPKTKWTETDTFQNDLQMTNVSLIQNDHPELIVKIPLELFEVYFDDELFEYMKEQFHLYATRDANKPTFSTTIVEIKQFVGLILLSGYHRLPRERDYWSTAPDLGCNLATQTMSRGRFHELKRFCHLADNNALANSKLAKVLPLYDRLNKAFLQFGVFHEQLSIDESMVPYFGHHSAYKKCL